MADDNAVELIKRGDNRFSKRASLDGLRQEIALNFAPWLASWQAEPQWGQDFCSHLLDGTPLMVARDFIGQIRAMLRPSGKQWFWHRTGVDTINNDVEARSYLDWRSTVQMRVLSDRTAGFDRATAQADEMFGLFGDLVISVDLDPTFTDLRFRNWHTADCVWAVGNDNQVDVMTRRERVSTRVLMQRHGKEKRRDGSPALHEKITEAYEKNPDQEFEIRHEVIPCEEYDAYNAKKPFRREHDTTKWCSVWVDVAHKQIIREVDVPTFRYVVPRWMTVPGMPYAISPATTIALPDARLIQQQMGAILEAAEKQINPPLIGYADTVRGTVDLQAGGLTWVDKAYDDRTGAPLQALELGKNFGLGIDSLQHTQEMLKKAFFLDILRMPDTRNSKSTVEVQFLIDEYVRAALPLFAPMQAEYNTALLYESDKLIEMVGGYRARAKPESLKKLELQYQWDNPLGDMIERQKAHLVSEVAQLGQTVAALQAAAAQAPALHQIDLERMFKEAAIGVGASNWLRDDREVARLAKDQARANAMQQMIASAPNIAKVVDSGVNAAQVASGIPNPAEPSFALPSPA